MSSNIFGSNVKQQDEFKNKVDTHSKTLVGVIERQKGLESSVDTLHDKLELLDHNAIKNFRKVFEDLKHVKDEIKEMREDINSIKEFNSKVSKQLRLFSSKDEVVKLERYIDLWDPLNFVTRSELDEFKDKFKDELANVLEEFLLEDDQQEKEK